MIVLHLFFNRRENMENEKIKQCVQFCDNQDNIVNMIDKMCTIKDRKKDKTNNETMDFTSNSADNSTVNLIPNEKETEKDKTNNETMDSTSNWADDSTENLIPNENETEKDKENNVTMDSTSNAIENSTENLRGHSRGRQHYRYPRKMYQRRAQQFRRQLRQNNHNNHRRGNYKNRSSYQKQTPFKIQKFLNCTINNLN